MPLSAVLSSGHEMERYNSQSPFVSLKLHSLTNKKYDICPIVTVQ